MTSRVNPANLAGKRLSRGSDPGLRLRPRPGRFVPLGIPYFEARSSQCAWLLPETDHLPVEQKLVCGHPVPDGAERQLCPHHLDVSSARAPARRG